MEFNNKRLSRTSTLINYTIAIILCGFLIGLSGKIIDDIDEWEARPPISDFENKEFLNEKDAELIEVNRTINEKNREKNNLLSTIQVAQDNYENEKESYENWLKARKTIGSPQEDKEIISRANKLDEYNKIEQDWRNELFATEQEIEKLSEQQFEINKQINEERDRAYEASDAAYRKYELKVFLIRLAFVLPILLLGIYFLTRFRKHKYWPLFFGFILFAVYSFFFGLLPYLPSYGGYVRYTVGIILSIFLGVFAINKIRAFIQRKKEELKASNEERAKSIQSETAEKALNNHMCPSCGKDFIMKNWDLSAKKGESKKGGIGYVANFCRYCGLELFKKCEKCDSLNFAHLPYCSNCGHNIMATKEA